jgi:hypothetical protein
MFASHCHRCGLESAQTAPGITGQVSYKVFCRSTIVVVVEMVSVRAA